MPKRRMPICACGCNEPTKGGVYKPGHDAKLRKRIEENVGGLRNVEALVQAARKYADSQITLDELGTRVQGILGE